MTSRQQGFTLIEVVVAFAIVSLAFAALYQSFASTLRGGATVEKREHALLLGQSLLDRIGRDLPLQPGEVRGNSKSGFEWVVAMTPYATDKPGVQWPVPTFEVLVTVSWGNGDGRRITLRSLELGART